MNFRSTQSRLVEAIQDSSGALRPLDFGSVRHAYPCVNAVKGSWLDDHTFVVERRILGHGETQRWTLAFDGRKVDVRFEDTDGAKAELHGEADE
jgi:hypothetical protein